MPFDNRDLFPFTADVNPQDHLTIGGCDTVDLADEFGTPLLVFDEVTLRGMCRDFVQSFQDRYADTQVLYASKAFVNAGIARVVDEEGLGLDVVSGGELAVAVAAGVDLGRVYFHGNNKTPEELEYALEVGCGRIVVDSFYELRLLNDIAKTRGITQDILLRLSPSVDPHTHVGDDHRHPGQQVRLLDRDRRLDGRHPAGSRCIQPGPGRAALSPRLADFRA